MSNILFLRIESLFMKFYFCERYINTDADDKKVERDMYTAILYFRGSNDHYGYEIEKIILKIYSVISLLHLSRCAAMSK